MNKKIQDKLFKAYYDPSHPGSLGGLTRLAHATKVPLKLVQQWAQSQLGYTLHKPVRQHFKRSRVIVRGINQQWSADLVDLKNLSKYNKGMKYLLTVVDVFSKYAFVHPLKSKSGPALKEAFETIFTRSKRIPLSLHTDKGKEFLNSTLQRYLKQQNVHHFVTQSETKVQVVERFNRTLKERMFRAFTIGNTLNYLTLLPKLLHGYNASHHCTIGMAPKDVNLKTQERVWNKAFRQDWLKNKRTKFQRFKFKVGDKVRISKARRTFKKGYLPGWTEEVFVIRQLLKQSPPAYKIEEYDGTMVKGTFYEHELQHVDVTDDDLFRIDRIIKKRGKGNNAEALVAWKNWPAKYNSWLKLSSIIPLKKSKKK